MEFVGWEIWLHRPGTASVMIGVSGISCKNSSRDTFYSLDEADILSLMYLGKILCNLGPI